MAAIRLNRDSLIASLQTTSQALLPQLYRFQNTLKPNFFYVFISLYSHKYYFYREHLLSYLNRSTPISDLAFLLLRSNFHFPPVFYFYLMLHVVCEESKISLKDARLLLEELAARLETDVRQDIASNMTMARYSACARFNP